MRAFTLIEVLFTLFIIALGISLGLANFNKIQTSTSEKTLRARLKQLNIAKTQFIQEYNRLEAQSTWVAAADDQARYDLLKRYIERPQSSLSEAAPLGYTLHTPNTVWDNYTGDATTSPNTYAFTEGN